MKRSLLPVALMAFVSATTLAHAETLNISHDMSFGASANMDPIDGNRLWEAVVMAYDRLVRPSQEDGMPEPSLATAWYANEDATIWTFDLRDGVLFHNGTTMDAADVSYSFNRVIAPETDVPVKAVLSIIEKIEIVDDLTVAFHLKSSHADFPLLLLDYRARVIPQGSGDEIADTGIGTGPFMLQTLDPEGITELKAFADYWGGTPKLDAVQIIGIADSGAVQQAFAAGQLDWINNVTAEEQEALGDEYIYHEVSTGDWRGIVFNTQSEEFSNPQVRRALKLLADREEIIARALGEGRGTVACDHPVWPGDPYHLEIDCAQDIEAAKALLTEAGYPDGLSIEVHTAPLDPTWTPMLEVYQAQAREAGVDVQITTVPGDGFWNDVWMKVPAATTYWGQRPADQILNEAFRSGAGWNETYWESAAFDTTLDAARAELDGEARIGLYHELQQTLYEQGGAFIPFFLNRVQVVQPNVSWQAVDNNAIRWHEIDKE